MTVYDFLDLCYDKGLLNIEIYDFTSEKVIYSGLGEDVPFEYEDLEVQSYDVPYNNILTLNVEL